MIKLLQSLRRRHHPDVDALSAHLDGRLDAAEAAALDAHVAGCEACRAEMEGLRAVRVSLGTLPDVEHPRSFRLRVADVERVRAKPVARGGVATRLLPALSGVAALVFVVAAGADLASTGGGSASRTSNGRYAAAPQRAESQAFRTMAAADSAGAPALRPAAPRSSEDGTYVAPPPVFGSGDATAAPEGPGTFAPDATPGATRAASAAPTPATAAGVIAPDDGPTSVPPAATGNKSADASPTGELSPDSQRQSGSDDDDGLRAVEIIAGIVAVAAAAGAIALRMRRRGEQT